MDYEKYRFLRALRPFSFTVALFTCLTGIAAAAAEVTLLPERAVLVVVAGILLQAGVNLINDYADLSLLSTVNNEERRAIQAIQQNFRAGLLCFAVAAVIAFYLIAQIGLPLLLISVIGLAGALCYTLDPVNYKARGLGVVLVFWLMGVLMVTGSYLVMTGELSALIFWQSVPISLLVSLLLLSNEIRDYEADQRDGIGTLAVRMGYQPACRLYVVLLAAAFLAAFALFLAGHLPLFWPLLCTTVLVPMLVRLLNAEPERRRKLTPGTGRLLALFGLIYCLLLQMS